MKRGQLSIEFMFSAGVLIMMLLFVVVIVAVQRQQTADIGAESRDKGDCLLLATAITKAFDNPGTSVVVSMDKPSHLSPARAIAVGEIACSVPVPLLSADLPAGRIAVTSTVEGVAVHG